MFRLLTPLLILIFGITISVYSYRTYGDFSSYGAAFYPTVIGGLVSLFALIDFIMEINLRHKYIFQVFNFKQDLKIIALVSAVIIFYIFAIDYLGFILTTICILSGLSLPLLTKHRIATGIFLVILSICIYFLFAQVLLVPLSNGILFE